MNQSRFAIQMPCKNHTTIYESKSVSSYQVKQTTELMAKTAVTWQILCVFRKYQLKQGGYT